MKLVINISKQDLDLVTGYLDEQLDEPDHFQFTEHGTDLALGKLYTQLVKGRTCMFCHKQLIRGYDPFHSKCLQEWSDDWDQTHK